MKHVLQCPLVSDEEKVALCTGRAGKEAANWLATYHDGERKALQDAGPQQALTEAEIESLTPAERNARKRQQTLDERVVHKLTALQITAIHYAMCTFFFVCRIPFLSISHWAFVGFAKALNPAYVPHLFSRKTLSTTWLKTLRNETEEKVDAYMDRTMGKQTIIIDGFKDRRGRHVMNISNAKVCG